MTEVIDIAKIVAPVVTTWFAPAIQKVTSKYGDLKLEKLFLENALSTYLQRTYEKNQYLTTLVFPNQKLKLDHLYQPLSITRGLGGGTSEERQITSFPVDIFKSYQSLLLVDTAGMGKSTLAKLIFLSAIRENTRIPVLIELRRLSREKPLLSFILSEITDLHGASSEEDILKIIKEGGFLFIFDGYDEIPNDQRDVVTADIQDFHERALGNLFLMTSRDEPGLSAFASFMRFSIKPLERPESFELIRKYSNAAERPDIGCRLIEKLDSPDVKGVEEFLSNPLLVSLLFRAFDYKHTVPLKRILFYRQVYDALFESHDLSKDGGELAREKKSGLDVEAFDRVLRQLAIVQLKDRKVEFSKDELLTHIELARSRCPGLSFSAADFLNDLTSAVPLFVIDGSYYRWAHRSLQEYFAAQFICRDAKDKQAGILVLLSTGKDCAHYLNLLSLCYEIDYKSFLHSVVKNVLVELTTLGERYKGIEFNGIPEREISRRIDLSLLYAPAFTKVSPQKLGRLNPTGRDFIDFIQEAEAAYKAWKDYEVTYNGTASWHSSNGVTLTLFERRFTTLLSNFCGKPGFEFVVKRNRGQSPGCFHIESDLDADRFYFLDSDPHNVLNRPGIFTEVNDYLEAASPYQVNFQLCGPALSGIEASIKASESEWSSFFS